MVSSRTHCEGHQGDLKRIFLSRREAKLAVVSAKWLVVYECPDCKFWHVSGRRRSKPFWVG